jgi:hypothetical protein
MLVGQNWSHISPYIPNGELMSLSKVRKNIGGMVYEGKLGSVPPILLCFSTFLRYLDEKVKRACKNVLVS